MFLKLTTHKAYTSVVGVQFLLSFDSNRISASQKFLGLNYPQFSLFFNLLSVLRYFLTIAQLWNKSCITLCKNCSTWQYLAYFKIPLAHLYNSKKLHHVIMTLALLCRSWFILNLQVKTFSDVLACKKWNNSEQAIESWKRLEHASCNSKQMEQRKASFFIGDQWHW